MLRLIMGAAGTGKTREIMNNIKQCAAQGIHCIFIVPEQFTQGAEGMVYELLKDELAGWVSVLSFTRYAKRVLGQYGGIARHSITDPARVVIVRRALDKLGNMLPQMYSHRRSISFCSMCADTINELKTAGCEPGVLENIGKNTENADKLKEIGILFDAYEALIANVALDPADCMTRAAECLDVDDLRDTAVFVDNFDGFTYPEYRLLDKLVQARECTVALCSDGISDNEGGFGLFSTVKAAAARLRALASKRNVDVAAVQMLSTHYRHAQAPTILAATRVLEGSFSADEYLSADNKGVYVSAVKNKYEECKAVAAHIKRLSVEGVPFGKIAIICRSKDDYKAPISYELKLAGIPFFMDESYTPEHSPAAALLRAALALVTGGLTAEGVMRIIKTGLCGYENVQIAELENYVYTWKLSGKAFREPFTLSPSGFGQGNSKENAQDKETLAHLERMRLDIMPKLEAFISAAHTESAADMARALYALILALNAEKALTDSAAAMHADGANVAADRQIGSWNEVMSLLSQMELLLGGEVVSPQEYDELFLLLLRSAEIGAVPQIQNAVIFTSADRMRLQEPRVSLIVGVSEGEFPKQVGYSGLLTHTDRELLVQSGVDMAGSYETRTILEQIFFYKALSSASEQVYFSFIAPAYAGVPSSTALQTLVKTLDLHEHTLDFAQRACSVGAAVDMLAADYHNNTAEISALREAIADDGYEGATLSAMDKAALQNGFDIDDKALTRQFLGDKLRVSPTRIERYYSCAFAYFLQYVLGIRARKRAELTPLESGSLVHYILEQAFIRAGSEFTSLSDSDMTTLASELADAYISANMPDASRRFAQMIARIKKSVARLLMFLREEQKQSSFHPVGFEENIGKDGLKPLTFTTPTGEEISVIGNIDRVDVMRREGKSYIRVIDYKTGDKSFDLEEVYSGLDTQMLLYLFTAVHSGDERFTGGVPAGVMYLHSDPAPKQGTRGQAEKTYSMDGLLLDDEMVLRAMDKDATGVFIPVKYNKDGTCRASKKLASLAKIGNIEKHIEALVTDMASALYAGEIGAVPLVTKARKPCDMCDYRYVCLHEDGICEKRVSAPDKVFEEAENELD